MFNLQITSRIETAMSLAQRDLVRPLTISICFVALFVGCENGSRVHDVDGDAHVDRDETLGIIYSNASSGGDADTDCGSLYFLGRRFIVWTDKGNIGGSLQENSGGVNGSGRVVALDGREVEFEFDIPPKRPGIATFDGQQFELSDGAIFLVTFDESRARIEQIKRDLTDIKLDREGFSTLRRNDEAIMGFFGIDGHESR